MGVVAVEAMDVEFFAGYALDGEGEGEAAHGDDDVANVSGAGF